MADRCSTCIFRPGNPMKFASGQLAEVVEANRQNGSALICHKTTYGQAPELGEVVCRGFFDVAQLRVRRASWPVVGHGAFHAAPPREDP